MSTENNNNNSNQTSGTLNAPIRTDVNNTLADNPPEYDNLSRIIILNNNQEQKQQKQQQSPPPYHETKF